MEVNIIFISFACQILIYKSNQMNSHRKAEKICLSEHAPGGCEKSKNVQYTIGIDVPSVPPTDLTSSSVCRVKYELQVSISIHTNILIMEL